MKKTYSFISALLAFSLLFGGTGCAKAKDDTENSSETVVDTSTETTESETSQTTVSITTETSAESKPVDSTGRHLDTTCAQEIRDYCLNNSLDEYGDEFNGHLNVFWDDTEDIIVEYVLDDPWSYFSLRIFNSNERIALDVQISYDDGTSFYLPLKVVEYDEIGEVVANIGKIDDSELFRGSERYSAFDREKHDYETDFAILYARFMTLSEKAFSKIPGNHKLTDYGLVFNDTVPIDPCTPLSNEIILETTHHFVEGVCADEGCGITWEKYVLDSIRQLDPDASPDWAQIYGQQNKYMTENDYVSYVDCPYNKSIEAYTVLLDEGNRYLGTCSLSIVLADEDYIHFEFRYDNLSVYDEQNNCSVPLIEYVFAIDAAPGDVDEVFTFKDSLLTHSQYIRSIPRDIYSNIPEYSDESVSDEEIRQAMIEHGYTEAEDYDFFTKDEMIEEFFTRGKTFLLSINETLSVMNTSLKDRGIEMENIQLRDS